MRVLLGILKAGDIALFVTSGSYSADAKHAASGGDKFIRLIDGDEFIDMWQEYYDKMSDDDKLFSTLSILSQQNFVSHLLHHSISYVYHLSFVRIVSSQR